MDAYFSLVRRCLRHGVCVWLALSALSARADTTAYEASCPQCSNWPYGIGSAGTPSFPDPVSAAQAAVSELTTEWGDSWSVTGSAVANGDGTFQVAIAGPGGRTGTIVVHAITVSGNNPPSGNPCGTAGAVGSVTLTVGWSHNPGDVYNPKDLLAPPDIKAVGYQSCLPSPSSSVACGYQVTGPVTMGWVSETPNAQGLYRIAAEYPTSSTGGQCPANASSAESPTSPSPACDGFVGQVGGVTKCVPAAGGTNTVAVPSPTSLGNPAAGTSGLVNIDDPSRSPANGTGDSNGGPPTVLDGRPANGSTSGGTVPSAGTGASGGGSSKSGTSGINQDGGECQQNPSAAGCGGSPASVGSLYTGKGELMGDAFTKFKNTVMGSPFATSVTGFFAVSGGGTCPTWNATIPYLNASVTIDQFCSTMGASMLAFMKVALLIVAGFMAFRIAVDN